MAVDAFLVRLVVVGRDDEEAVGAEALERERLLEHRARVVRARPADHRNAARDALHRVLADGIVLFVGHGGGFAGRAEDDERIGFVFKMKVDEFAQLLKVDGSVFMEGRHEGDEGAAYGDSGHDEFRSEGLRVWSGTTARKLLCLKEGKSPGRAALGIETPAPEAGAKKEKRQQGCKSLSGAKRQSRQSA